MVAEGVNDAVMVLIDWIMKLAPYAVFALIAAVVAQFGLDLLRSLLIYTLTVTAGSCSTPRSPTVWSSGSWSR
jgi:Na+/H+-dicarboxylate symporter